MVQPALHFNYQTNNMYNRTANFIIAGAGMLLFGITLITLGSVLPDLKIKFGLDDVAAGALFAILPFGILAGSLLFGYFCDRYGYRYLLAANCLLIAIGLAGIAYLKSITLLQCCIFGFGFGGGCVNGATNALVADISGKNKGANLSLLGVFFAIGALGIPLILGFLKNEVDFEKILYATAFLALLVAIAVMMLQFPPGKNVNNLDAFHVFRLFKNEVLLLIAFFLFFQSSLEAIVHNWITTYIQEGLKIPADKALYALTANVIGMAVMRLLTGSIFRKQSDSTMLQVSMLMLIIGSILLLFGKSFTPVLIALVTLGAGMAAGFPMMYSIVGTRHADISATAFSFILTIALLGNMLINYIMGVVAKYYGIHSVAPVILMESVTMSLLCYIILQKINREKVILKET